MKRGQTVFEFMLLIGAVSFLFVIFLFGVNQNITGKAVEERNIVLEDTARTVQDEINLASESSDGYYREFRLPSTILGFNYDMTIEDMVLYVRTNDENYALSIPVGDVEGQPVQGTNIIKKVDGKIYLNEGKRGQSALEFLILIGALLFFITGFVFAVQSNIYDKNEEKRDIILNEVASTVQDEINLASESSDGYYREFDLSSTIGGLNYDVVVDIDSVYVYTNNGLHATSLPVRNVVGDAQPGMNFIVKINGKICLNLEESACLSCGNGVKEDAFGEECDGDDFLGIGGEINFPSCMDANPENNHGGVLCSSSCKLDYSLCSVCGNNMIDGNESCDGDSRACSGGIGGAGQQYCIDYPDTGFCDGYGMCVSS